MLLISSSHAFSTLQIILHTHTPSRHLTTDPNKILRIGIRAKGLHLDRDFAAQCASIRYPSAFGPHRQVLEALGTESVSVVLLGLIAHLSSIPAE